MNKNRKYLFTSITLAAFACLIAVILRLFTQTDLWFQIFAAVIGVIITAIITQVLLRGQTENDAKKEKDTKIFEEKLRIYQDFLHCLCEVIKDGIKDGKITKEEAIELEFQTSYITMHTKSEHIKVIAEKVQEIVGSLDNKPERKENKTMTDNELGDTNNKNLMISLFKIVEAFKKELYPSTSDKNEVKEEDNIKEVAQSFGYIIDAVERKEPETEKPSIILDNDNSFNLNQYLIEFKNKLIEKLVYNDAFWNEPTHGDLESAIYINLAKKGKEQDIRILFDHETTGEQYFQVHLPYDDTHDIYKQMKWRFGGRQNKWSWWKYLDNYKNLASSEEFMNKDWDTMLAVISKQLNNLIAYVESYVQIREEIYEKVPHEKANVWMYYENCVAFDYDKTLGENDKLFMDVTLNKENNEYSISFGNRDDNTQKLLERLKKMGYSITESDLKEKRYTAYNNITAEEVIEKINEIDAKI